MAPLLQVLDAGVLTLTVNRPDQRNALTAELVEALHGALDRAELDATVRLVMIRGAGRDFCTGTDLDELATSADRSLADNEQRALRLGLVFQRLRELPKPVVAIVHGRALAAGMGLAAACDVVLAAESAEFGYPELGHGLRSMVAMVPLRRLVGEKLAVDLVLTGRSLTASAAAAAGLVSRVIPDVELGREAAATAKVLSEANASVLALAKQLYYRLDHLPLSESLALGATTDALVRSTPEFRAVIDHFLRQ